MNRLKTWWRKNWCNISEKGIVLCHAILLLTKHFKYTYINRYIYMFMFVCLYIFTLMFSQVLIAFSGGASSCSMLQLIKEVFFLPFLICKLCISVLVLLKVYFEIVASSNLMHFFDFY